MQQRARSALLTAACAVAALGASQCAPSHNSTQAAGEAPRAAALAPAVWTAQTTPQQIADRARAECGGGGKQACIERILTSAIRPVGVDKVMAALGILAKGDADIQREGHVYAHGIGIAAYQTPETVSRTFSLCTVEFQSGCYHGVIQGYFADSRASAGGLGPDKLNALCRDYRSPEKRWLQFQCAHGMGHGLMAIEDHDLLRSLDTCDVLAEEFEKQACYGGAFMENVINVTSPHHMATTHVAAAGHDAHGDSGHAAAGHEGHDAHAGHDMGQMAGMPGMAGMAGMSHDSARAPFKALDPAEPLYPCTIVKAQHRHACYLMQTSAVLYFNHGDFADAARQCGRAPQALQSTCFISLGRDANSYARGSRERALGFCTAAPAAGQPYCVVGVVKNMVDVTANPADGMAFCRMAPDASKPACYRAVGQEIALLQPTPAGREGQCRTAEQGYIPECRQGAGLPLVPTD